MNDFSDYADKPNVNALEIVSNLVDRVRHAVARVNQAQVVLDEATADLNKLVLHDIPDVMELAGLSEYRLLDGALLTIKPDLKASITKANEATAFAWLVKNGHGGAIKRELHLDLRSLDNEKFVELETIAREQFELDPQTSWSIHPSTLKALVKELLENGKDVTSAISVYQFRKAVVKEPKAS